MGANPDIPATSPSKSITDTGINTKTKSIVDKETGANPDIPSTSSKSIVDKEMAMKKLKEIGYAFNAAGQLRLIDEKTGEAGNEPYKFEISGVHFENQVHYEKIAALIPDIVYELLEQNGLSRITIPEGAPFEQSSFFFSYPEKLIKPKKLIVLIHGSGFVRAGQWARSLIINQSLDHGTQIPYIKRALELGYSVVVTNTNDNRRDVGGKSQPIPNFDTPLKHASYVWEKYVMACDPEAVAIVAHSAGGGITTDLAKRFPEFFKNYVFGIAFTDSFHTKAPVDVRDVIGRQTCNWVSSIRPLDTELKVPENDFKVLSAGHSKHEWTSYTAFKSVFAYLEDKYAEFKPGGQRKRTKLGD